MSIYKVLIIVGFDLGGGVGIQVDIKIFQEFDVFGMFVIMVVIV